MFLALELEEVFSLKAKENLSKGGGDKKSGCQISDKAIIDKIDTRKELEDVFSERAKEKQITKTWRIGGG